MSKKNNELLDKIRHSTSHLLAYAVKELFGDQIKFAIGPTIDEGFYYDFDLGDKTFSPEDLPKIEKKMAELIKKNPAFERSEVSIAEAKKKMADQPYKLELIEELENSGEKNVSFYCVGNFEDLCRGPHVDNAKELGNFKLLSIAGAYWRGSEKNKMLQRIYGTAFTTKDELATYIKNREEAEKRDHRKIGRELDLFHIDDQVGPGLVLWHPKGGLLWQIMEDFWHEAHLQSGYDLVRTPHIGNQKLWEMSGHWGFYNASMYPPLEVGQSLNDAQQNKKAEKSEQYLLKPMNCPFHVQIYNNRKRSYRELPCRWAECGTVYRFEKTGELSGLTRVRGFTQDDAHIICRQDQVEDELKRVIDFILYIYQSFGFPLESVNVYLSLRDPKNQEKYAGNEEGWNFTEKVLKKVAQEKNLNFTEEIGEAAFYGPKLDFKIKDAIGREWQCSTLQFDFNLPPRFDMKFTNQTGQEEQPYMLHRALFGSFERFIGLLIEHYAGAFPIWLAPNQVTIIPVSEKFSAYGEKVLTELRSAGLRADMDASDDSLGKRIRNAEKEKVPYILVVGEKEQNDQAVAIRQRGEGDLGVKSVEEFCRLAKKEIEEKK